MPTSTITVLFGSAPNFAVQELDMHLLIQITILGECIGVLVGISASPVAGTVIAALIASATLALSVIGGFAKSADRADSPLSREVDLVPFVVFSVVVLIAAISASVLRSKIVRIHMDGEIVRSLSAPPEVDRIIDSWVAIGRRDDERAFRTAATEGETGSDAHDTDQMSDATDGIFSREEIATWLLGRRTQSNQFGETTADIPFTLYSSKGGSSLSESCHLRRSCEEGEGGEECLSKNFFRIKYQGSEELSGIAKILEGNDSVGEDLLIEVNRYIVLDEIMELLCQ